MEEQHHDDQSHYEISLTAGQAFVAFVLLLLSLAASFAFGLMLGKGNADERLVVQKETPVVTEASLLPTKKSTGQIVELGVANDDFVEPATTEPATETTAVIEEATTSDAAVTAGAEPPAVAPATSQPATSQPATSQPATAAPAVPHFAQLLSTTDQKVAEALAAKLIDGGFNTAYVERGTATEKGPVFRVRVKFPSEGEARGAEAKLREFSKDVWITAR